MLPCQPFAMRKQRPGTRAEINQADPHSFGNPRYCGMETSKKKSGGKEAGRRWPWWEPYVFTAFAAAAFVALLIVLGFVAEIPFAVHILFAVMTLVGLLEAVLKPSKPGSVFGCICAMVFFGLAGMAYVSQAQVLLGIGYSTFAAIWAGLSIKAGITRHRMRREQLARLDRALDSLRGAVQEDQ